MKIKYIIAVIIILTTNICANAMTTKEMLMEIENGIFGYDYSNENEIKRIERLEEYMYGEKKSGTVSKRLEAIQNDAGIAINEKKPGSKKEIAKEISQEERPMLKEDDTVDYPIVDKMEYDVFHQTYASENIYDRLNRLETKIFQKTSKADLNDRVDRLAAIISPQARKNPIAEDDRIMEEMQRMYKSNNFPQMNSQVIPFQLATLETDILKHDYTGDNNASRLARLEEKLFNRTFQSEADMQRLQRLLVAYESKKDNYKYENNKRMQNMATISQIGGILLMILAILL